MRFQLRMEVLSVAAICRDEVQITWLPALWAEISYCLLRSHVALNLLLLYKLWDAHHPSMQIIIIFCDFVDLTECGFHKYGCILYRVSLTGLNDTSTVHPVI